MSKLSNRRATNLAHLVET